MSKQLHNELNVGTPSTLYQAIANGIEAANRNPWGRMLPGKLVQHHVRDFLAQKFAAVLLEANDAEALIIKKLWEKITGETLCLTTGARSRSIDNTSNDLENESRG